MDRIVLIADAVWRMDADAVLITTDFNRVFAASGFSASRGQVVITKDGDAYYLTDSRYLEAAEKRILKNGFSLVDITSGSLELGSPEALNQLIRKHGIRTLAVENKHLTIDEYRGFERVLQTQLVNAEYELDALRAFLSPEDRDQLEAVQALAELSLHEALEDFRVGMTEQELQAEIVYHMYRHGAEELAFKFEILSGENASMPHGVPSDRPIKNGDCLITDIGMVKNGFWSDMTRTFAVGYATEELEKVYYTVLEAQNRAIRHQAVGVTGKELDAVARTCIESSGLAGCYQHALGHAIGMVGVAPMAIASRTSDTVFRAGNTITVEPGIYQPGICGCRIEDILWLGENNEKKNLTHFPKDKLMIL